MLLSAPWLSHVIIIIIIVLTPARPFHGIFWLPRRPLLYRLTSSRRGIGSLRLTQGRLVTRDLWERGEDLSLSQLAQQEVQLRRLSVPSDRLEMRIPTCVWR